MSSPRPRSWSIRTSGPITRPAPRACALSSSRCTGHSRTSASTIEDLVVDGSNVWLRMVATGTNSGPFMGHAPTGRPMRIDVFDVIRVEDGLMVEHWGVPDRLGAMLQLGLLRPPGAVAA